jgi:hypothetical protein
VQTHIAYAPPACRGSLAGCAPAAIRDANQLSRPATFALLDSVIKLALHPCQQAAAFLPCTRPPDFVPDFAALFRFFAPVPVLSPTLTTYGFSTFCCRPRPRLRASCLPGIPRRTSRGRPKTQDHRHSEGIICWASCWIIRRATSSFFSLMVISSSSSLYS